MFGYFEPSIWTTAAASRMIYVCRSLFPSIRVQKLLERLRTEVATDPTGNSYGSSLTALRREKIWRGPLAHSRDSTSCLANFLQVMALFTTRPRKRRNRLVARLGCVGLTMASLKTVKSCPFHRDERGSSKSLQRQAGHRKGGWHDDW